jgi:hypothetical protein
MLLRCESLGPPMSQMGQNRLLPRYSIADRFASSSGHCSPPTVDDFTDALCGHACGRACSPVHRVPYSARGLA